MAMSIDTRLGVLTLGATLLSAGAFWLWPDKKWPGWVLLSLGIVCLIWLIVRNVIDAKANANKNSREETNEAFRLSRSIRGDNDVQPIQIVNSPVFNNTPQIVQHPVANQSPSQSQQQVKDRAAPSLNFECVRARMIDVEVDLSSFEILLTPSEHNLPCMAAVAEFRRNTDDSDVDSISIRTIAELQGRNGESLSINEGRWLEHNSRPRRSSSVPFKRLETKRLAVVLGISNNKVYTYEGRYQEIREGIVVFYKFIKDFQELNEGIYDVEIRLVGTQGGRVLMDDTFTFEFIRGAVLKDSVFRKKTARLSASGTQPGKSECIKRLSKFAEEGDELIVTYREKLEVDWPKAKDWAQRTEIYISEQVSEESAAYFSLETREHAYPGGAVNRVYVDWVHTRIQRIAEIAAELRKQ